METNQFNFERVWHGSRRSHPIASWPAYLVEAIFAVLVISLLVLELVKA